MTNNPVPPGKPYLYAFSTGKLVLIVCMVLALMVLSLMLGIRIERHQRATQLVTYDSMRRATEQAVPEPVVSVPAAGTTAKKRPKTIPGPSEAPKSKTNRLPEQQSSDVPKAKTVESKPAPAPEPVKTAEKPKPKSQMEAPAAKAAPIQQPPSPKQPTKQEQERYSVQISASKDKSMAISQVDLLKKKGFTSYLEEINVAEKGRFFRVMVGPFTTKTEADKVRSQLIKDSRFTDSYVRQIQ